MRNNQYEGFLHHQLAEPIIVSIDMSNFLFSMSFVDALEDLELVQMRYHQTRNVDNKHREKILNKIDAFCGCISYLQKSLEKLRKAVPIVNVIKADVSFDKLSFEQIIADSMYDNLSKCHQKFVAFMNEISKEKWCDMIYNMLDEENHVSLE